MVSLTIFSITTDIVNAAATNVPVHKDCVESTPLTIDATPLNQNTMFTERKGFKLNN